MEIALKLCIYICWTFLDLPLITRFYFIWNITLKYPQRTICKAYYSLPYFKVNENSILFGLISDAEFIAGVEIFFRLTALQAFDQISCYVNWYIAPGSTCFSLFSKVNLPAVCFLNPVKYAGSEWLCEVTGGWGTDTICVQICLLVSSIRCLRCMCSSVHIIFHTPLGVRGMHV